MFPQSCFQRGVPESILSIDHFCQFLPDFFLFFTKENRPELVLNLSPKKGLIMYVCMYVWKPLVAYY